MVDKFLAMIKSWSDEGMRWPFVYDPTNKEPSITLMFFYCACIIASFFVSLSSTLMLIKGDYITSTFGPLIMLVMGFVFHRLRHLDTVKIDLDDKQIELSDKSDGKEQG